MRRVARKLNVGTMSLYHYVKTKDDLIAVMDDALMSEALMPSIPEGWQDALTEIATRTHALFLRHPWALSAMLTAPPGLNAMRHMEQCLQALAKTKMTSEQKFTLLAMVDDFVFGHALREAADDTTIDLEFAAAQMATGAFPELVEVFGNHRPPAQTDRFQIGLRVLLEGKRSWTR
jgi:AcrR family transcriptional regulator